MSSPVEDSLRYNGPAVYPQAIALSALAFVAFLLTIPPLIVQVKGHNLAVIVLISSISTINLLSILDAIIWPNDNIPTWYSGVIFCDIQAKLQIGFSIAIPSSATCICRNLAQALSKDHSNMFPSRSSKRRRLAFEIILCIILPVYIMSVHILVQPYRYFIYGISGCYFALSNSWLTVVLVIVWPILISLVGTAYGVLIFTRLLRHRQQVSTILIDAQVSKSRFVRVLALSVILIVVCAPLEVYTYFFNDAEGVLAEWQWASVHPVHWSELIIRRKSFGQVGIDRWVQVGCGFLVFGVFGIGDEALVMYRRWAEAVGFMKLPNSVRRIAVECTTKLRSLRHRALHWTKEKVFSKASPGAVGLPEVMDINLDTRAGDKAIGTEIGLVLSPAELE